MAETKLTNEFVRSFDGHEKIRMTKAAEKLTEFGEKQNDVNEALAGNINSLIKRVCALEDKQEKNTEIMKKIANELAAFKRELNQIHNFFARLCGCALPHEGFRYGADILFHLYSHSLHALGRHKNNRSYLHGCTHGCGAYYFL